MRSSVKARFSSRIFFVSRIFAMGHHQLNERCLEVGASVVVSSEEGEGGGGEFEYLGRAHAHSRGRCPQLVHQHLKGRFDFILAPFLHLKRLNCNLKSIGGGLSSKFDSPPSASP